MAIKLNKKDKYVEQLEKFVNSIDVEISNRVSDYRNGKLETSSIDTELDLLREKIQSKHLAIVPSLNQ